MSSMINLPDLPLGDTTATLLRWLAQPGDVLVAGQPLAIVLSVRAEILIPTSASGTLAACLVAVGGEVAVGAALARVRDAARPQRLSPLARRIADVHSLDVAMLHGSGPGGRIMKRDLAAFSPALLAPTATKEPQVHAPPMPFLTTIETDLSAVQAFCAQQTASQGRRPAIELLTCVAAVVAQALVRHPLLNSRWSADGSGTDDGVQLLLGRHGALVRDAQDLNLYGIARALQNAANPAPSQATFVLVQAGMPLYASQALCASLTLDVRASHELARLTLRCDARIVDPAQAAAFLHDLTTWLARFTAV